MCRDVFGVVELLKGVGKIFLCVVHSYVCDSEWGVSVDRRDVLLYVAGSLVFAG